MMRAWLVIAVIAFVCVPDEARAADTSPPRITHAPLATVPLGESVTIEAKIEDESPIFDPAVLVRFEGDDGFLRVPMTATEGGRYAAVIPISGKSGVVRYFIEAFDENGNGPSLVGSAEAPLSFALVEPPPPQPEEPAPPPEPAVDPTPAPEVAADESEGLPMGLIVAGAAGAAVVVVVAAAATAGGVYWWYATPPASSNALNIEVSGPTPVAAALGGTP